MNSELVELRNKIDKVDSTILCLIRERLEIAAKIGILKKQNNLPVLDSNRENIVIQTKRELAIQLNINPDLIEKIFWELINEAKKVQE